MIYIGRYKENVNFQGLVSAYPALGNAQHLPYVYMFIIDTDDEQLLDQLRNDPRINYVQEDRKVHGTDLIEKHEYEEVSSISEEYYAEDSFPTENGWGYNTPTTALTTSNGTIYYYWHLEHLNVRDLLTHSTYHSYSYIYDGNGVDAYVLDSGINKGHPHLLDASNNARAFGLPGHGGDDGVTGVEITSGGNGYTTGQSVTFSGGSGSNAAGYVTTSSGAVDGVRITNFGSGYTSAPSITFPVGGAGAAGTVTIGNDDNNSHGTQCALCIGGNGRGSPQGQYGPGVAKEIKFYAVKVLDYEGSGYSSQIVTGINAVIAHNTVIDPNYKGTSRPSVINFSIGHGVPNSAVPKVYEDITGSRADTQDILEDALKTATSPSSGATHPVHVVQSAGNGFGNGGAEWYGPMQSKYNIGMTARTTTESNNTDTGQGVPICVGATKEFNTTTMQLNMAYFSNYGATATTIMTSGQSVIVPKWDWTIGGGNTVYALISGTSFASPIIAGLVALRLGEKPTETPSDLKLWLTDSTTGASNPDRILEIMVPTNLGVDPISITASSTTVGVNWSGHNLATGNLVQINGSTAVDGAGMPADGINGWWTVTVIDTNNFTFTSTITAGSTAPTGGGTLVQGCKVTGTFEATDGVIDNGSTLYLVDNSNVQTAIKYTPISYSDNYFAYSPYQDWIVSWLTAAGSLGTIMKGDPVNYNLSAGIATLVPEEPFPVTYTTTSVPNGATLNSSTGQLTGNLTTAGVNNFTVQATNGYKTDARAYSILVEGNVRVELSSVRMKGGFKFTS